MTIKDGNEAALRVIRDRLVAELAELDRLGEPLATIELSSAIEILNNRLGEPTSDEAIAALYRKSFLS